MPLNKFGFAFITSSTEPYVSQKIPQFQQIETVVRNYVVGKEYGRGVKEVYVGILLNEPEHARRFLNKKPQYKVGKREERYPGHTLSLEDNLEFYVAPRLEDVRRADSLAALADALNKAFQAARLPLQKVAIPNFDAERFLLDLSDVLTIRARSR